MSGTLAALLALLFFAPLTVIYGRRVAARIHRTAAETGRGRLSAAWPLLVLPTILGPAMLYRLVSPGTNASPELIPVDSGVVRTVLGLVYSLGSVAALLFFLTIPFVLGRFFGAASALLGYFRNADETVLGFGGAKGGGQAQGSERPMPAITIAIDGPAAAGKGTLAKRLAAQYGLAYLDTGLLYRAVGRTAAAAGIDLDDPEAAGEVARTLAPSALDDGTLRGREAGELASRVAVHPPVRAALVAFQRDFANDPRGAVLDGRDIGTVICPQARVKIFVTASAEVRARRRTDELAAKGRAPDYERILEEVRERDARDSGRTDAPLRPAADAHLLDTSEMDIEAAFQAACRIVDRAIAAGTKSDARLPG